MMKFINIYSDCNFFSRITKQVWHTLSTLYVTKMARRERMMALIYNMYYMLKNLLFTDKVHTNGPKKSFFNHFYDTLRWPRSPKVITAVQFRVLRIFFVDINFVFTNGRRVQRTQHKREWHVPPTENFLSSFSDRKIQEKKIFIMEMRFFIVEPSLWTG